MTNNVAKRNSDLKQDDKLKKVERALTTWLLTKSDKNFQQMHITNEMRCNEFSIQSLFLNGCTWKLRCKPQSRDNTSQSPRWTDGYLSEIFFPLAQFSETPWALLCPIQQSAVTAYQEKNPSTPIFLPCLNLAFLVSQKKWCKVMPPNLLQLRTHLSL